MSATTLVTVPIRILSATSFDENFGCIASNKISLFMTITSKKSTTDVLGYVESDHEGEVIDLFKFSTVCDEYFTVYLDTILILQCDESNQIFEAKCIICMLVTL